MTKTLATYKSRDITYVPVDPTIVVYIVVYNNRIKEDHEDRLIEGNKSVGSCI